MGVSGDNRKKNRFMLTKSYKKSGFDLWRHNFTAYSKKTGEAKTFFIEVYIVNPAVSPETVSFENADSIIKKDSKPCFLMLKAGCWGEKGKQLHAFYPIDALQINKRKLNIRSDNFLLTESELFGSIEVMPTEMRMHPEYMSDSGSIKWKIKMDKKIAFDPKSCKTYPVSNWYVQGSKTMYGGTILLDGEEYAIVPQKSYGHADKIWGKDFPNPFLWLSSCNLISIITGTYLPGSCFDVGGSILHKNSKSLQVFYCQQNQSYYFSKSGIKYSYTENKDTCHWTVTAENTKNLLDVEIFCNKKDMIQKRYLNIHGSISFDKFWSGGNGSGEVRLYKKSE